MNSFSPPIVERTARRFDAITIAGAGLVGALLLAAVVVVAHDSGSDPVATDLPYLPFAGEAPESPIAPAVVEYGEAVPFINPAAPPPLSDTSKAPEFVMVVGSLQLNASAPSDAGTLPGCGQIWTPRLQVEGPDGQSVGTAVLQSGMMYGPISGGGRVSWNCTYRYQVGVLLDQPSYVFHAYGGGGGSGVGTRSASASQLTGGQGPTVSVSVCSRCGYNADRYDY